MPGVAASITGFSSRAAARDGKERGVYGDPFGFIGRPFGAVVQPRVKRRCDFPIARDEAKLPICQIGFWHSLAFAGQPASLHSLAMKGEP
ncbi:MAG TPA: hypothetical protein VH639_21680, partial [Bryobacteraceae bacterium]